MKTRKKKSILLVSVLVLFSIGIYSCNDNNDDQGTSGTSQEDQTFTMNASGSNIAEIEFGRLALTRATNDSIRAFAQTMLTDHTNSQRQLDSIAKSLNIRMSDSMNVSHRTLYRRLSGLSSFAFDTAYINSQVMDHQATRTLLQNQISRGNNANLVKYATKNLPIVNMHLQHATNLRTYLNQTGGSGQK